MWAMILFDNPSSNPAEQKSATQFRNVLLDLGFEMCQYSIYTRFCKSSDQVMAFAKQITPHVPKGGTVKVIGITDAQFKNIVHIDGQAHISRKAKTQSDQLQLF